MELSSNSAGARSVYLISIPSGTYNISGILVLIHERNDDRQIFVFKQFSEYLGLLTLSIFFFLVKFNFQQRGGQLKP